MDVTFKDESLDRLETDATYSAGFRRRNRERRIARQCSTFAQLPTNGCFTRDGPFDLKSFIGIVRDSIQ